MMTMGEETWAGALAVNDPRRPAIGRAMFSTLWAAAGGRTAARLNP